MLADFVRTVANSANHLLKTTAREWILGAPGANSKIAGIEFPFYPLRIPAVFVSSTNIFHLWGVITILILRTIH